MARVTVYTVAGEEFEHKRDADRAAAAVNRELAIDHHRRVAHVRALRATLDPQDLRTFDGDRLDPEDVLPDPESPEPLEPIATTYDKVYDVVSSRDGERVVIGLTNRRQARDEADRLNAEIRGDRVRRDHDGAELPPAPTALNATVPITGADGDVVTEQPQHLRLAPMTEYSVQGPRLQPVPDEEPAS